MSEKEYKNFFVERPIVSFVISIIIVIVGVVSALKLPIEQYPNITPPVVEVRSNYKGANAISVEESVSTPLEQQINGVDNMIYMKSTNDNTGSSVIQVSFEVGTDPDMNTVFTQNNVSAATAKLPPEVTRLGVTTKKSLPNILMLVSLYAPDGRYDQNFLGNYSLINIKDELARVPGIGRVDVLGSSDYAMRIWVKPDRLAHLGVTVPELMNAINEQNVIAPGGKFGAEPSPPGTEFTYTVRLPDRLQSPEEFENIVVRTNDDGSQIKMKDVARVELGVETYDMRTRFNAQPCAMIAIYQSPGSNAVDLAATIRSKMIGLEENFPSGMEYKVSLDTTLAITAGLEEIVVTLIVALLLVILVVYLFIQDWRATIIPTLAIPVSLVGAFMLFPMLGFTINVLSLLGLVLAIGIVVDDAIVVVEAVQQNMDKGMNPKEATNAAMKEVTAPVIATTLVLLAVFAPTAAMSGITGSLYQQFAITIAVSVVFSSINALSLSPALCSILLKPGTQQKGILGKFFGGFNKGFDRTSDSYMKTTNVLARKLTRGVVVILLCLVGSAIIGKNLPGGFVPEEDMGYALVNIQLPAASSLQRSDVVAKKAEQILAQVPEVDMVTTATGFSLLSGTMSSNSAFIFVSLKPWDERELTAADVVRKINFMLYQGINEGQAFAFGPPAIPGLGNGSGYTLQLQDRDSREPAFLAEQVQKFMLAAEARPEIGSARSLFQASVPQRGIDINRDKVLKSGIQLGDVYNTFGAYLGGTYVNDFTQFGRLYKTYIMAEPEYRNDEALMNLAQVKNKDGEMVPLSSFAQTTNISGPEFTNRFNLYRSAEITGSPAEGYSSAQALDALEEVADEVLPDGMGISWANMSYQEKKASGSAGIIFVFSLVFVFLILAAQYESWSLPLSILLGTPFAILGALLFLYLARFMSLTYENNIFAQISLVMLIAMAAKNAILIVEFAKIEFDKGLSLFDAAINAARLRFRPILMTAFSFILGILPLIFASGSGAEARKVMGMALLGGMGLATVLGLFFYPMLFILIGKLFKYEQKRDQDASTVAE